MNLREMLELAGVDTSKGKARELLETEAPLSETEAWLNKHGVKNYIINKDGSVDVRGNVDLHNKKLTSIPVKFGKIDGDMRVCYNMLASLKNCGTHVSGDFDCSYNRLTSMDGLPRVGGKVRKDNNQLRDKK